MDSAPTSLLKHLAITLIHIDTYNKYLHTNIFSALLQNHYCPQLIYYMLNQRADESQPRDPQCCSRSSETVQTDRNTQTDRGQPQV